MVEIISISAIAISVITAIATALKDVNLKHCNCFCIDSDCRNEDKNLDKQMKELNIKIDKNKKKLEHLNSRKRLSSIPETPTESINSLELITEI